MKILRKSIVDLDVIAYHILHLQIINPMLPVKLTGKEAEVLAHFMSLPPQVADMGRFNSITKRMIRDRMSLSIAGMSNYMKALESKKCIIKDQYGNTTIQRHLIPNTGAQGYQFKIVMDKKSPTFIAPTLIHQTDGATGDTSKHKSIPDKVIEPDIQLGSSFTSKDTDEDGEPVYKMDQEEDFSSDI